MNDLQSVIIQVISVHLYCWWILLCIVSVSSLSIVNKCNVIAKTITNIYTHDNCNLFNGIIYICTNDNCSKCYDRIYFIYIYLNTSFRLYYLRETPTDWPTNMCHYRRPSSCPSTREASWSSNGRICDVSIQLLWRYLFSSGCGVWSLWEGYDQECLKDYPV